MIYEFKGFQLDAPRRELRLRGREVPLQPRVFDVLLYLISHRERVVSKEELLGAVWTDSIVSDGSLKRAVSLARSALRQGDMADAIRSYPRQGYRFDFESVSSGSGPEAQLSAGLAQARQAYLAGDWNLAIRAFAESDAQEALGAVDLERWADAKQISGDAEGAIGPFERAAAAHGSVDDVHGLARAALALAQIHYEHLQLSVSKGWLRRAQSALSVGRTREHGLAAAMGARICVAEGELAEAVRGAELAIEIGRELDDVDIQVLGMNNLGIALVAQGDVRRGVAVHDEAAALVLSGSASPVVGGLVYCGIIWTCRNRGDWERAAEWTQTFTRWCSERSVELHSGNCRLHHAEVLHHRGDWVAAEREARHACDLLSRLGPYAEGDACRVLGDLKLQYGDLDGAEKTYRRAHELGWDPQPGYSQLLVKRGRVAAALRALERSLLDATWANRQRRGLLLASLVGVALQAGDVERAKAALAELEQHPEVWDSTANTAIVAQARAEYCEHTGDASSAVIQLRQAVRGWHQVGSPWHVAKARLRLARLYLAEGDADAAELELSAVRNCAEQLANPALMAELEELVGRSSH